MNSRWRRASTILLLTLALGCAGGCRSREAPTPPNLLLIVVDCLRADRVGAEGPYAREVAPHLESLAAEGVSFTRAIAQASWTRPSVPTLLTGLYPSEHGLGAFRQESNQVTGESLSPAAVTLAEALRALGYSTALFGQQNQLAPKFGLDQGFDTYEHKSAKAERIHGRFLGWLEEVPRQPFFAYIHYEELHWPYCPPPETRGRFTAGYQGRSQCADWRRLRDDIRSGAVVLTPEETAAMSAHYDEELLALDHQVGVLVGRLRELQLWDDTLVLLTSDHGEEFFEHGGMAHGTTLYDELIRVPLVVKPPKSWRAPAGEKNGAVVELRDVFPTFLEAAGGRPGRVSAGRSLLPWIRGEQADARGYAVTELGDTVAVRTAEHKLIVDSAGSAVLYDLTQDPGETRNVADEQPNQVALLERHLRQWRSALVPIEAVSETLDDETVEGLRALGYLD